MAGLATLKHTYNLSDEVVCELWVENPYYQYFCGEEFFRHFLPWRCRRLRRRGVLVEPVRVNALISRRSASYVPPRRIGGAGVALCC
jgi:Transposase domain (DUF772)